MPPQSIVSFFPKRWGTSLVDLPPVFLAPALYFPQPKPRTQCSNFSTSPSSSLRDRSRLRGVSAIHRTGPRYKLSVAKYPLPKPAPPEKQEKRQTNPDHGLWGFFAQNKQAIPTPEEEYAHGMDLYGMYYTLTHSDNAGL